MDMKPALLLVLTIGFVSAARLPSMDDWFLKEDLPAEDSSEDLPARDLSTEDRVIRRRMADADEFNEPARRYFDSMIKMDTSRYSRNRYISAKDYRELFDSSNENSCVNTNEKVLVCCPIEPTKSTTGFKDQQKQKQQYKRCERATSGDCGYKIVTVDIVSIFEYKQGNGEICNEQIRYIPADRESVHNMLYKDGDDNARRPYYRSAYFKDERVA